MRHRIATMLLALSALNVTPLVAQRWETLGTRRVSFVADRDVIHVGAIEGRFDAIRIEIDNGDLEMFNLRVFFGDGSDYSPTTRFDFREGSRSRVIDLPGGARVIRRVTFDYASRIRRGRATVQLLGRHADAPQTADVPSSPPVLAGWEHLGSRTVSFRADHDVVTAAGQGRVRQIQFTVEGGDLEMYDMRVTFGNGDVFSPTTRVGFQEGSRSRTIDLPGAARIIRSVAFHYRSVAGRGEGRAVIHVYGR